MRPIHRGWLLAAAAAPVGAQTAAPEPATQLAAHTLAPVTVTGTRERALLSETPASIGVIAPEDIRFTAPAHPQQLLGQVPGVAVAVTNGEGHTTAIRQPFTTSPLYLFLEDGIPTRATGFFNHNALYELNLPQAGGIEVVRGPGTALYGSDAIGGTINVLSRAPLLAGREFALSGEAGSFGWGRVLAEASAGGVRAALNVTHTDGWRDATAYDRGSVNLRWDAGPWKTILGATKIDQQTGANAPLVEADYRGDPTKNNFAIAFRKVDALRLSTQFEQAVGAQSLLSLTPYLRHNRMELNGSFNLSFDPRIETSTVTSVGVLAKWRHDWAGRWRPRLIVGVDIERSPGSRREDGLDVVATGQGADRSFDSYSVAGRIYDYDVTYRSLSAYAHGEASPLPALRLTAGLRVDRIDYAMRNGVGAATTTVGPRVYGQQPRAEADFERASPKLGATWQLGPRASVYASLNDGFRVPSEGQLFRAGAAANAADAQARAALALQLKPIKARQLEVGLRADGAGWNVDAAAYRLDKRDDLVSQRDLASNVSTNVNAGRTRHQGVEVGVGRALGRALGGVWRLDAAWSYAKHTYVDWVTANADFSGNEIESAPRTVGNLRLQWTPRDGSAVQLEWLHLGSYWLEAGNAPEFGKYAGHDVLNLRLRHAINERVAAFVRILNLADKRHADSAGVSSNTPVYSPALPRNAVLGLEATW
jgi:iron complex outermembrane receptor protein